MRSVATGMLHLLLALLLAAGHARGGAVRGAEPLDLQEGEVVREKITELRAKLRKVQDLIAAQKGASGSAALDGTDQSVSTSTMAASAASAKSAQSAERAAEVISRTEVKDPAASSTAEASVDAPAAHLLGSTTRDLPSDRPLNPSAEQQQQQQRMKTSKSTEIHQIQHDTDAALHERNRFARDKGSATVEKSQVKQHTPNIVPPLIEGAGTELEDPGIGSIFPERGGADNSLQGWEASDQAAQSMDTQTLTVNGLQSQMDQILGEPLPNLS